MKEIGIINFFGGYNSKKNKENDYGFLEDGTYLNLKSLLCEPNELRKGAFVIYEQKGYYKRPEATKVQLLKDVKKENLPVDTINDFFHKIKLSNDINQKEIINFLSNIENKKYLEINFVENQIEKLLKKHIEYTFIEEVCNTPLASNIFKFLLKDRLIEYVLKTPRGIQLISDFENNISSNAVNVILNAIGLKEQVPQEKIISFLSNTENEKYLRINFIKNKMEHLINKYDDINFIKKIYNLKISSSLRDFLFSETSKITQTILNICPELLLEDKKGIQLISDFENNISPNAVNVILNAIGLKEQAPQEKIISFLSNTENEKYLEINFIKNKIKHLINKYDDINFIKKIYNLKINSDLRNFFFSGISKIIQTILNTCPELLLEDNNVRKVESYLSEKIKVLESISEKDFLNFQIEENNFITQILFIKKSLYFYKKNKRQKYISNCLEKLNNIKEPNLLVQIWINIINSYAEDNINHDVIIKCFVENIWNFISEKQEILKDDNKLEVLKFYFSLILLPLCCHQKGKFREARLQKKISPEELEEELHQWQKKKNTQNTFVDTGGGDTSTCTGKFRCLGQTCYHAEVYDASNFNKKYNEYTLLDLLGILNLYPLLKIDRKDKNYYIATLSGWINLILSPYTKLHFFCSHPECDALLIPCSKENQEVYYFDWYKTVNYLKCPKHLENEKHDKSVYISHCKHKYCDEVIDSRLVEIKCSNDRYVCRKCGLCNCDNQHIINKKINRKESIPCIRCSRESNIIKKQNDYFSKFKNDYNYYFCKYCKEEFPLYPAYQKKRITHDGYSVQFNIRSKEDEYKNNSFNESFLINLLKIKKSRTKQNY